MMMKRVILFLTICLAIPALVSAQSLDKAQKQMDKYNYAEAISILQKAAADDKTRNEAIPMLAECYRMQRDVVNAKATYAQAVELPEAKPETFYYYAQALQSTGDYAKAREMYQKYAVLNPADHRGSLFVAHCDSVLGPWKDMNPDFEIKLANNINTAESQLGPAFYDGQLVFASDFSSNPAEGKEYGWTGRGYLNIVKARPLSGGDFWGSMGASSELEGKFNQEYHDGPAAFSADGNSIYFTRSFFGKAKREGIYKTNLLKIYYATKTDGNWGEVKPFFLNSTEFSVGHPALSPDGQTLYFVSDMPGGQGKTDIWMCKREGEGWSQPTNLGPNVNTKENEMFPSMRGDGVLYFASEGLAGYGALDIFKTKDVNGTWTTPVNLHAPINGPSDDFAIAFAPGDKNGFFSSNRVGGVGNDDIYAFRDKPILPAYISGLVKDKASLKPIAVATVFLFNPKTGKVKVLKTGPDGMYKTVVDNPADYVVKAMMPNFIADCSPFKLAALKPGSTLTAPRDLLLDKLVINKTFRIDNIYYDYDKFNIREDAKPELNKLVSIMKENQINVELGSHTDCRGSFDYNDKLSQKRAESAVDYIISSGIDKSRITAKGYGEHQLVNKCADGVNCTPEEHQANRRTEFKVTGYTAPVANTDQFDYSKFKEGDDVDLKSLPEGFLMQCK
jgi:outer membrane protein OmpA-like peptidoglycan-associated protein/tetratricopeptide (TPR) repeat protein